MINESIIKNHLSMNHLSIINHQMYSIYVMGKKIFLPSNSIEVFNTPPRRFRLCCFGCRFGPENWALLGVLLVQHLGAWASPPPSETPVSEKVQIRGENTWKMVEKRVRLQVWNKPFFEKTKIDGCDVKGIFFLEKIMACWLRGDLESETQLLLTQKNKMEMNELTFFFQSRASFFFESSPKFHPQVSSAAPIGRFSLEITVNPPGQHVHIPPWENVGIRLYIVFI